MMELIGFIRWDNRERAKQREENRRASERVSPRTQFMELLKFNFPQGEKWKAAARCDFIDLFTFLRAN